MNGEPPGCLVIKVRPCVSVEEVDDLINTRMAKLKVPFHTHKQFGSGAEQRETDPVPQKPFLEVPFSPLQNGDQTVISNDDSAGPFPRPGEGSVQCSFA